MPPKGLETVYIYPREYTTLLIRPLRASKLKIHRGGGIRPPGLSKYSQTPVFLGLKINCSPYRNVVVFSPLFLQGTIVIGPREERGASE